MCLLNLIFYNFVKKNDPVDIIRVVMPIKNKIFKKFFIIYRIKILKYFHKYYFDITWQWTI